MEVYISLLRTTGSIRCVPKYHGCFSVRRRVGGKDVQVEGLRIEYIKTSLRDFWKKHTPQTGFSMAASGFYHLAELHAKGITHGDIKPSNVMVREEEPFTVVFIDLGRAQQLKHVTRCSMKMGSGAYSPGKHFTKTPCLTDGAQGKSADMFSFGMTLLTLCGGRFTSHDAAAFAKVRLGDKWLAVREKQRVSGERMMGWIEFVRTHGQKDCQKDVHEKFCANVAHVLGEMIADSLHQVDDVMSNGILFGVPHARRY
jgi:serine/threonine protein kinase